MASQDLTESREVKELFNCWWVLMSLVLLFATAICVGGVSPPTLTDAVDAVQAQVANAMLATGDWATRGSTGFFSARNG
jgi:4-amino-4-deoxy-L-arabinose transferase-like glycosyltransferase